MEASIDISLYPLQQEYVKPILAFIDALEKVDDIVVVRNPLSTQVFGDFNLIMRLLDKEISTVLEAIPDSVFVIKIVGRNRLGVTR